MDPILVTGGAGFIGSHLCESLLRQGNDIAIVDNLDDFYHPNLKKANLEAMKHAGEYNFYPVDIRNSMRLREVFDIVRPRAVVHLAARAGVRPSMLQPDLYVGTNIGGTTNLLELSQTFRVERFIFASSSSVYGSLNRLPFSEDDLISKPLSVYAATKVAGEALAFTYAHLYGLSVICLRIFTAFGPRQRPDLAIRRFAGLIEGGKEIPIFGDGSMARDYTYVADVAEGLRLALDCQEAFEVFNLGNSRMIPLNELIEILEAALGKKAVRKYLPAPRGEMPVTFADLTKSRKLLGYDPKVPFEEGIRRFVKWFKTSG